MTTCLECGKYNSDKKDVGTHWICQDCNVGKEEMPSHDKLSDDAPSD